MRIAAITALIFGACITLSGLIAHLSVGSGLESNIGIEVLLIAVVLALLAPKNENGPG